MNWVTSGIFLLISAGVILLYVNRRQSRQLAFIKTYHFHKSIKDKIHEKYPGLDNAQAHLVFRALRDYFSICNMARRKMVSMPSKIVDDAWHEFILFTRTYELFCRRGIGRFLHHTPTEAMQTPTLAQDGIKRAWRLACIREGINPGRPDKLPLLFAIDALLNIPGGFTYVLDCKDKASPTYGDGYCAGHIGCASGCAGDSASNADSGGFFDGIFSSSEGSSDCGGGCGGD